MKIVLAHCGNGYAGCDMEDISFYPNDIENTEIEQCVWDWACENAESYAYVHFGWSEEYTDEEYEDYISNYVDFDWHILSYEEYVEWCENWGYEPKSKEELGK